MDAEDLLAQARDAMTARRVFGEPIERDGTTLLPVASVMGGAGGGSGRMAGAAGTRPSSGSADDAAGGAATPDEGSGYGFGMMARPLGVYVIRGDEVTWEPAIDRNRQLTLAAVVAVLAILAVRSVLLAIARR
jgi:uncharacterized spore protein YtfJ